MAKEEINDEVIETLKSRGLSCGRLKSLESNKIADARTFRSVGFLKLADREEQTAREIRSLRSKVCKLR